MGCVLPAYGSEPPKNWICHTISGLGGWQWRVPCHQINFGGEGLRYLDSVVSSAACFAGGQRTIYQQHSPTNLKHSFQKILPIHCGPSAIHCLDTRLVFGCRTHHWTRRVLHWQPLGQRRLGRPKQRWDKKLEMICCYQGLVHREGAAQDHKFWIHQFNYFLRFCCQ